MVYDWLKHFIKIIFFYNAMLINKMDTTRVNSFYVY